MPDVESASIAESASGSHINQTSPLSPVAQKESTRSYFLAQTLESTRTVPMVSASLPLDTGAIGDTVADAEGNGEEAPEEGDDSDESDPASDVATVPGVIAAESIVIGSFERDGLAYAVEPGGDSVALVACDPSKLPQGCYETGAIVVPASATPDSIDYYSVTRLADGAFASLAFEREEPSVDIVSVEAVLAESSTADALDGGADSDIAESIEGNEAADAAIPVTAVILTVAIPASVRTIEDGAFAGADSLTAFVVASDNPDYATYDGCLYTADLSSLLLIPGGRQEGVRVPRVTKEVAPTAFSHCAFAPALLVGADSPVLASVDDSTYKNMNGDTIEVVAITDGADRDSIDADRDSLDPTYDELLAAVTAGTEPDGDDPALDIEGPATAEGDPNVDEGMNRIDATDNDPTAASSDAIADEVIDDDAVMDADMIDVASTASDDEETIQTTSAPFSADSMASDGSYRINRTVTLSMDSAAVYAAANHTSAQIFGRSYRNAYLVIDPNMVSSACLASFDGFTGTVSWTGGNQDSPAANSIVTVNVQSYIPGGSGNPVGALETFHGFKAPTWGGGTSKKKLLGFRNSDTGSYLSVETLYSGEAFTFSYKMYEPHEPMSPIEGSDPLEFVKDERGYCGNAVTDYGVCHRGQVPGKWTQNTGFTAVWDENNPVNVAVSFSANGGQFYNSATGRGSGGTGTVYSKVGEPLMTPTSPVRNGKKTFLGWFYKDENGVEKVAPAKAPTIQPSGSYYLSCYAKWADSTNSKYYENGFLVIDPNKLSSAFLVSFEGFTGTVSWTGGNSNGPDANSIITVNVEKYIPSGGNPVATLETYRCGKATSWGGGISKRKLLGFRNSDTGSYLSVETIYSGKPFTFSYKMYEPHNPMTVVDETVSPPEFVWDEAGYCGNAITEYGVCHRGSVPGYWTQDTGFTPVWDENNPANVAVRFNPNGGVFVNGVTGKSFGGVGTVFSKVGEPLETPTSPVKNGTKTFLGWFYKDENGVEKVAPAKAPTTQPSGDVYITCYAKWENSTATKYYENAHLVIDPNKSDSAFMVAFEGFTGSVSWTGGTQAGPSADSIVTVNVQSYSPASGNAVATLETYHGWKATSWGGGTAKRKLLGFRNSDTGAYLSVETLYSGEPFTFSYKMYEPHDPMTPNSNGTVFTPDPAGYCGNAITDYGVCHRGSVPGYWTQDTGFTPVWEENNSANIAVLFDPNGGKFVNSVTSASFAGGGVVYSKVGEPLATPMSPVKNGTKTFLGWFYKDGNGAEQILPAKAPITQPSGSYYISCYAKWEDSTITWYTLDYDKNANVATGVTHPTYMYIHGKSYLADNGFERPGYTFDRWNTKADGTGLWFEADTEVAPSDFAGKTINAGDRFTLYAIWTADDYSVRYQAGEGKAALAEGKSEPADVTCTYDKVTGAPVAYKVSDYFERKGYAANSWKVTKVIMPLPEPAEGEEPGEGEEFPEPEVIEIENGAVVAEGDPLFNLTTVKDAIVVMEPVWTLDTYTISIDMNDGNYKAAFGTEPQVTYQFVEYPEAGQTYTIAIPTPTRPGYVLAGWTRNGDASAYKATIDPAADTGDMAFKANWTPRLSMDLPVSSDKATFAVDVITGRTLDDNEDGKDQEIVLKSNNAVDTVLSVRSEAVEGADLKEIFGARTAADESALDEFIASIGYTFAPANDKLLVGSAASKQSLKLLHEDGTDTGLRIAGSEATAGAGSTELQLIEAKGLLKLALKDGSGEFVPFAVDMTRFNVAPNAETHAFSKLIWTMSLPEAA